MASPRSDSTPICRCRVLYLGSAVPHITKDGLQGIQEPLRELYPEQGALGARGIDSWLSVWSNGILLENVDENHKKVTRFFPIETLHYCAAVRYVLVPEKPPVASSTQPRFLPLDSPFARSPNPNHPPLFACILRRTTGIKVLECHAFICKREMAANALVRCCFHAYADSAYARHIDGGGGGSVYGTLRNGGGRESIEKVEGWRRGVTGGGGGSTLTLNSALLVPGPSSLGADNSNSADDLSIYNGDENHKIWAGSGRDVSEEGGLYGGGGSTLRSGRSSRPRQSVNAPPPPPPPAKEEKRAAKKAEKERAAAASRRRKGGRGVEEGPPPAFLANGGGSLPRGPGGRPANGMMTLPGMRGGGRLRGPPPPPAALLGPPFLPLPPHPLYMRTNRRPHPQEEPVYMPSARPLSPVSSYQPCHFPHEAYLMQQYATVDLHPGRRRPKGQWEDVRRGRGKGGGGAKGSSLSLNAAPTSGRGPGGEESDEGEPGFAPRRKDKEAKRKGGGGGGEDEEEESPYNTGIYRRKGHLNERAFSYSIRQEHRSRSYGSLANLKFAPLPVVPNGGGPPPEAQYYGGTITKEEMKKEREIMQMMQDLELSGDELERSEVPPSVYQQARQRNAKIRR